MEKNEEVTFEEIEKSSENGSKPEEPKENPKGFKRYLLCLKKGYIIILIFGIILSLLGLLISNLTYKDKTALKFVYRYQEEVNVNINDIISDENIEKVKSIKNSWFTGSKISTYAYVEIKNISISKDGNDYIITVDKSSFELQNKEGVVAYNNSAAKGFLQHLAVMCLSDEIINEYSTYDTVAYDKNGNEIKDTDGNTVYIKGVTTNLFDKAYEEEKSLDSAGNLKTTSGSASNHKLNMMIVWSLSGFGVGVLLGLLFIFIFIDKLDMNIKRTYDNKNRYRTPFHISFFKDSVGAFKDIKSLTMMSALLALVMVCKFIPIPSGFGELGLSFAFLFLACACMLFGPVPALGIGFLSDVLGYLVRPDGSFFFPYTIQAILACFIYALVLHKTYITFTRCLIARVGVNLLCNAFWGTLCRKWYMGLNFKATKVYFLTISLPKNLVYLLPQALLLYFVLKALAIPLEALGLIESDVAKNTSFF
ncbi:MAG: folate family ECF transporter S component [Acholeplasmatales bacterium]|nr:folate family ECF transporter S component [Acholeplasmatales bacterium]